MRHPNLFALTCFAAALVPAAAVANPETVQAEASAAVPAPSPADVAFGKLKALVGDWTGTVTTRDTGPKVAVQYRLTAGGSVVMEKLFPGTPHEMVTMYHKSGGKVVLTHFCALGNQPEMELAADSTADVFKFSFAGGGVAAPEKDTHMHSGSIQFLSVDSIEAHWQVWAAGKAAGTNDFFLTRTVPPKS